MVKRTLRMKQRLFIFSFLLTASLGLAGCSSEDGLSSGETNGLAGREVSFSAGTDTDTTVTKKIIYGTGSHNYIPIYWVANDLIDTYSSKSTTTTKLAAYKVDKGGSKQSPISVNTGETPLTWNSEGTEQGFCAVYPSKNSTFIENADGSVSAKVSLSRNQGEPDYNYMAAYKYTNKEPVDLNFKPIMNVLRLTITDENLEVDAAHSVTQIVIQSVETTPKKIAGGFFYINFPKGAVDVSNDITYGITYATSEEIEISDKAVSANAVANGKLTVTAYLIPQDYTKLQITVYTANRTKQVTKTITTQFNKSSMLDLDFGSLNVQDAYPKPTNAVDLGCPVGGTGAISGTLNIPLYFANTNLVSFIDNFQPIGTYEMAPTSDYYANGKTAAYTLTDENHQSDLFNGMYAPGFSISTTLADFDMGSYTSGQNYAGDASYDVATAFLGSKWRLPTADEWRWIKLHCAPTWVSDYNGTGLPGVLFTGCSDKSITHDAEDHSGSTMFLPATGKRNGKNVVNRGSSTGICSYWTGTASDPTAHRIYAFTYTSTGSSIAEASQSAGLAVRPVAE